MKYFNSWIRVMDRLKNGVYLKPKNERIVMLLAQRKEVSWISQLLDVTEDHVLYVAKAMGLKVVK